MSEAAKENARVLGQVKKVKQEDSSDAQELKYSFIGLAAVAVPVVIIAVVLKLFGF